VQKRRLVYFDSRSTGSPEKLISAKKRMSQKADILFFYISFASCMIKQKD
jgi:hypothetical protein